MTVALLTSKKKSLRLRYNEVSPSWVMNRILAERQARAAEAQRYADIDEEEAYEREEYYFGGGI